MSPGNDEERPEERLEVELHREDSVCLWQRGLDELDPPISSGENFRDALLRLLDGELFQLIGLIVLFLVVLDGAFFFFLLVGWQGMCTPRTDCDPRNYWYNFAVQALNVLFTWTAIVSMPWRCTNAIHIAGWHWPRRKHEIGCDLYGLQSKDIWFHIPLRRRGGIILFLLLNCLTQFANQITRILYASFDEQNTWPGNLWTNVFFVASMACAAAGGGWLIYEETKLRKANPPGKFVPGLLEVIGPYVRCKKEGVCKKKTEELIAEEEEIVVEAEEPTPEPLPDPTDHADPTRHHFHYLHDITPASRASMRLFGM